MFYYTHLAYQNQICLGRSNNILFLEVNEVVRIQYGKLVKALVFHNNL